MGSDSAEVELITTCRTPDIADPTLLVECDFEIFGHVQGCVCNVCHFRAAVLCNLIFVAGIGFTKDCRDNCLAANITGWVKNSKRGTIMGKMQGIKGDLDKL